MALSSLYNAGPGHHSLPPNLPHTHRSSGRSCSLFPQQPESYSTWCPRHTFTDCRLRKPVSFTYSHFLAVSHSIPYGSASRDECTRFLPHPPPLMKQATGHCSQWSIRRNVPTFSIRVRKEIPAPTDARADRMTWARLLR